MAGNSHSKNQEPYSYTRAWNYALWLLGRQMLTEKQIREKLTRKRTSLEDIDTIITKLQHLRYLDDANYARVFSRSRKQRKGVRAIAQELKYKGVAEQHIDSSLATVSDAEQQETARTLLHKHAWRFAKGEGTAEDAHKNRQRAYAFLARRGFASDVVAEALAQHFAEHQID